jgi:hypothetical protein
MLAVAMEEEPLALAGTPSVVNRHVVVIRLVALAIKWPAPWPVTTTPA